ncbi:NAD(P)H-binding protein [Ulvibacter antarcticus]|uniref:Putative NAD(P)-binding protein n=1 Tax=Ulvibacter antarcticus TaxID=442714 RepID=A0A3L9YZV1_9FLAO|nr:NAD(P)H-binding protein [Ulvibacter antarcticus]RMA66103.1 putative NAD(P)-binding protein [Ulvibacter antarcticus]
MPKTAIILGATGLTGGMLLDKLVSDTSFSKVKVFSRSSVEKKHPKIEEHLINLFHLKKHKAEFQGDVVFCCIGTTKAKTPDKETYKKIDYGIPVAAAKLCKENGINQFIVVSAMGADVESSMFYNKVKGEMERDVLAQGIDKTFILQPSMIGGKRDEKRMGEHLGKIFMRSFGFLVPKKYKIIEPETIALAMRRLSKKGYDETIITSEKIKEIANARN